jgi:hypothetical protein
VEQFERVRRDKPPVLAALAAGPWIEAGEPVVLLGDSRTRKTHLLYSAWGSPPASAASGSAT